MPFDPAIHHRRSCRLKNYDYTQVGTYFITICTWSKECIFGSVIQNEVNLTEAGEIALVTWQTLSNRFPNIVPDTFIVMPNHVHGILAISEQDEKISLSTVVQAYKSIAGIVINRCLGRSSRPVWQRNYYEHIVRDDESLHHIREYILMNPAKWQDDEENEQGSTDISHQGVG